MAHVTWQMSAPEVYETAYDTALEGTWRENPFINSEGELYDKSQQHKAVAWDDGYAAGRGAREIDELAKRHAAAVEGGQGNTGSEVTAMAIAAFAVLIAALLACYFASV